MTAGSCDNPLNETTTTKTPQNNEGDNLKTDLIVETKDVSNLTPVAKTPRQKYNSTSSTGDNTNKRSTVINNDNQHLSEYKRPFSHSHSSHDDFEGKINRLYSYLLIKYHYIFLIVGLVITIVFTGSSFAKQPLPSFRDPQKVIHF
jgi:hypothetical protein